LWLHEHYHLVAAPQALPPDAMAPTRGEQIFLREGCYGCHAVSEWPALPPPGPALTFARSKLSREFIYTWLTRPQAYRSELRTVSHFLRDDSETTARALTAFILQSSQAWARARAQPQAGGEATYAKIGCTACHGALNEGFANLGAKTNATWIAAYLRQPTAY
jgi:cytochrome c551/c552